MRRPARLFASVSDAVFVGAPALQSLRDWSARLAFDFPVIASAPSRMGKRIYLSVSLCACLAAPAQAAARWTFCAGAALESRDIWISEVFATTSDRDRLEGELKHLLQSQGVAHVVAQCPTPLPDKTAVVNAQIDAEAFNKRLNNSLHAVSAQEFPPR